MPFEYWAADHRDAISFRAHSPGYYKPESNNIDMLGFKSNVQRKILTEDEKKSTS